MQSQCHIHDSSHSKGFFEGNGLAGATLISKSPCHKLKFIYCNWDTTNNNQANSRRREGLVTSRKTMNTQRIKMKITITCVTEKTIRLFVIKARVRQAVFCVNKRLFFLFVWKKAMPHTLKNETRNTRRIKRVVEETWFTSCVNKHLFAIKTKQSLRYLWNNTSTRA